MVKSNDFYDDFYLGEKEFGEYHGPYDPSYHLTKLQENYASKMKNIIITFESTFADEIFASVICGW